MKLEPGKTVVVFTKDVVGDWFLPLKTPPKKGDLAVYLFNDKNPPYDYFLEFAEGEDGGFNRDEFEPIGEL